MNTDVMSVLGLDLEYTVKYNPLLQEFPQVSPSGTPSGKVLYLTVYPYSRLIHILYISRSEQAPKN